MRKLPLSDVVLRVWNVNFQFIS